MKINVTLTPIIANRIIALLALAIPCVSVAVDYQAPSLVSAYPAYQLDAVRETARSLALKAKELNLNPRSPMTFTNLGAGDIYYALYSDMQIRQFNLASNQYLGGWKLDVASSCQEDDEECEAPWWVGRWGAEELLEPALIERMKSSGIGDQFAFDVGSSSEQSMGCLHAHPLRYADIDGNASQELIVIFNDSMAIFSPSLHKTIFGLMWNAMDWRAWQELGDDGLISKPDDSNPQYGSTWFFESGHGTSAAYRGYAKLYFSDFDADGAFDIVVWRKLYESRLQADPVKGFIKKSDTFVHYKLVNGEYKKQETDQTTVKGWLTAKQLTWQKGYPSKSECPGQEGQLIPEMHDPLLNDPEVLQ